MALDLAFFLIRPKLTLACALFGIVGCGVGPQRISRKSPPVTLASLSFGLGSFPCTSGGVKLKLTQTESDFNLAGEEPLADDRVRKGLADFQERLPTNILVTVAGSDVVGTVTHYDLVFSYNSIPICESNGRLHISPDRVDYTGLPFRHPRAGGKIDDNSLKTFSNPWPDDSKVVEAIRRQLRLTEGDQVHVTSVSQCAALDETRIVPLLDLRVDVNGTPFDILANETTIRKMSRAVFFANGRASFLKDNPRSGRLQELDLTDLADDVPTLNGSRFFTSRKDDTPRIERQSRDYILTDSDPSFEEVNVYANAERVASWLQRPEKNYTMDCLPVTLELVPSLESSTGPTTDNARYYPPKKGDGPGPLIRIAPGGKDLQLLRRDYDVLAHELGHHVLSRYLGGSIFQSVAIQEGVADFLVYAQTGDPCLAESICPLDSKSGCSVAGACLRTGKNSKIFDEFDQSTPYEPAEVLSSVLWNVGSRKDVGLEKLAKVILQSIPYLKKDSRFSDFFLALYKADLQMHGGTTACLIEEEAKARGFGGVLADLKCTDFKTK